MRQKKKSKLSVATGHCSVLSRSFASIHCDKNTSAVPSAVAFWMGRWPESMATVLFHSPFHVPLSTMVMPCL